MRVTVQIDSYNPVKSSDPSRNKMSVIKGIPVSDSAPRELDGRYWGYKVRGVRGGLKKVRERDTNARLRDTQSEKERRL